MPIVYNPITDFLTKDTLPKEDPDKVILGADFSAEFEAISIAFLGAVTSVSPTFSGTATFDIGNMNTLNVSGDTVLSGTLDSGAITSVGNGTVTGDWNVSGAVTSGGSALASEAYVQSQVSAAELGTVAELGDLNNVDESTKTDGAFLAWNDSASNWVPSSVDLSSVSGDFTVNGTAFVDRIVEDHVVVSAPAASTLYYRVDNLTYLNRSLTTTANTTNLAGIHYVGTGDNIIYTVALTDDKISKYVQGTPNDLSTATFSQSFSTLNEGETSPTGVFVTDDGLKLFAIGTALDKVIEYSMSVAHDLTTLSHVKTSATAYFGSNPNNIWFSPDGTRAVVSNTSSVKAYDVSPAYDVDGFTETSSTTWGALGIATMRDPWFTSDGLKMFICNNTTGYINECRLSSAFEVGTAQVTSVFYVAPAEAIQAVAFNSDGSKMISLNTSDTLKEWSSTLTGAVATVNCSSGSFEMTLTEDTILDFVGPPATGAYAFAIAVNQDGTGSHALSWPASVKWSNATPPTISGTANATDLFVLTTHDAGTTWYGFTSGQGLG